MSSVIRPTDIFLAVVGPTRAGKSTFISECTGQSVEIGHGLSCTTLVEPFTFQRNGFAVHLIDTPGFDSTGCSDILLLEDIAVCLNHSYLSGARISGVIYLHPINNTRVQGSAMKSLRIIQKICGPEASSVMLLGSTMWDKEDFHVAERREEELTQSTHFWGKMIADGCKTFRFYNDQASALIACDYLIDQRKRVTLALQHQMIIENKALNETDAGMEVEKDILQLKEICKSKIEAARVEAQRAVQMNNDEAARALATTQRQLQVQIDESDKALESMCADITNLQIQSENLLRDRLYQLHQDEKRDQLLLSERQSELDRLDRRLRELNDGLEINYTGIDQLDTLQIRNSTQIEPYNARSNAEQTIQLPAYLPGKSEITSLPRHTEVQTVLRKYVTCKKEIEAHQGQRDFRQRRIDVYMNRLGIGAGVVGAAFQIAAFAATMAACNIM